jgi:hypothetical protein
MHAAPPLRVGLARSRAWILSVAAAAGLAAANLTAWLLLGGDPGAPVGLLAAVAASAAAALGARLAWRRQAPLVLRWDGTTWVCDEVPGDVRLVLDLDAWMLLRFMPASGGPPRWIAAARRASDGPWVALRSTLYSRRPAAVPHAPPL